MSFDKESKSKYLDVIERIKEQIVEGKLVGRLPGERMLAKQFGYSYLTIRHAIDKLVADGILYKEPRKGTFVLRKSGQAQRSLIIGFYLHKSFPSGLSDPFYALIFKYLQQGAAGHEHNLIYFSDIDDRMLDTIDVIVAVVFPENQVQLQELSLKKHVVLIGDAIEGHVLPRVGIDYYALTAEMIDYAIKIGHRDLGFLSGPAASSMCERSLQGYISALESNTIPVQNNLISYGDWSMESGFEAARYYYKTNVLPTYIHCMSDVMAMGLIKGLAEAGYSIPDDISISGFGNIEEGERNYPSITTIAINYENFAQNILQVITETVYGSSSSMMELIVPYKICLRESTIEMLDV